MRIVEISSLRYVDMRYSLLFQLKVNLASKDPIALSQGHWTIFLALITSWQFFIVILSHAKELLAIFYCNRLEHASMGLYVICGSPGYAELTLYHIFFFY